jgi:hypothetical protein
VAQRDIASSLAARFEQGYFTVAEKHVNDPFGEIGVQFRSTASLVGAGTLVDPVLYPLKGGI